MFRGFPANRRAPANPGLNCPSHHPSREMCLRALETGLRVPTTSACDPHRPRAAASGVLILGRTFTSELQASAAGGFSPPSRGPGLQRCEPRNHGGPAGQRPALQLPPAQPATRQVVRPLRGADFVCAEVPANSKLGEGCTSETPLSRPVRLSFSFAFGE